MTHSNFIAHHQDTLCIEDVPLPKIAAAFGTPTYVYSRAALMSGFQEFQQALSRHPAGENALICYALKANSNLSILDTFARMGAGFDIVSGGELERVQAVKADTRKVVFSGTGKTADEMEQALNAHILCFNVESAAELERLNLTAKRLGRVAPVSLRVNPDVDPQTHPYISTGLKTSKFGVPFEEALPLYEHAASLPNLKIRGIDCHIGSQILDITPFSDALGRILDLLEHLSARGIAIEHLDLGGGLGISYHEGEKAPEVEDYLLPLLNRLNGRNLKIILEPGRRLVGNAGLLLTKVEYLKQSQEKNFAIVDAAMNDLIRPALYEAWHDILEVRKNPGEKTPYDVVGPICESSDCLGQSRELSITQGSLLAVMSAGAYGMAMSSNYNTRPRAAEVLVDGGEMRLIRRRETIRDLYALETLPFAF